MTGVFESPRLRARPWGMEDAEALFEMYRDPQVTEFLPDLAVTTLEEQEERTARLLERVRIYKGGLGAWAKEEKESSRVVGMIMLKNLLITRDRLSDQVEVGWHLARSRWGRGYATEMGAAAMDHGFRTLGLTQIHAVVRPQNARSIRVIERLGMRDLGPTTAYYSGESLLLYRKNEESIG